MREGSIVADRASSQAQRAKVTLGKLLAAEPGFVGVGLSAGTAGQYEIIVLVMDAESPVLTKVPSQWEGMPVRTQVGGRPRKF